MRILLTVLVLSFELAPVPEELASMAAVHKMTRRPVHCYLRPVRLSGKEGGAE